MFDPRIKIDRALYEKLKICAHVGGYSSVDEFVQHLLEKAASALEKDALDEDAVTKQLRGLGYLE